LNDDLSGQTIGPYQIHAAIRAGGMAVIYQAQDTRSGQWVAIKVLFPHLKHHHILTQIASALDYAHQRKVIHRDVKPANILMTSAGQAKLTDFGIARALQDSRLTTNDMRLGSPTYMSPEQTRGTDAGAQSDVYSLGVTIYELLTGRAPFQGDSTAISYQHVHQAPPPLRKINPALPPSLERVVNKALGKNQKSRYKSAGKFAAAFHAALRPENYQIAMPAVSKKPFPLAPALMIAAILIVTLAITALLASLRSPGRSVLTAAAAPSPYAACAYLQVR